MALTEGRSILCNGSISCTNCLTQKCDLLFSDLSFVKAAFVSFFMQIVQTMMPIQFDVPHDLLRQSKYHRHIGS